MEDSEISVAMDVVAAEGERTLSWTAVPNSLLGKDASCLEGKVELEYPFPALSAQRPLLSSLREGRLGSDEKRQW